MRPFLGSCVILAGFAAPAFACLNDQELPSHEREFRSQYRGPETPPPAPSAEPPALPSDGLLVGGGAVMLMGAVALTFSGVRARK